MLTRIGNLVCCVLLLLSGSNVLAQSSYQDYDYDQSYDQSQGYEQDTLYSDYAARQQEKEVAGAAGMGWGKIAMGGALGWVLGGKFHSRRVTKKLNAKHKEEQKAVYQQYYNDVYTLQQQNAELINALEQFGARVR